MHSSDRIVVYGATGSTGQLVLAELARRGCAPIAAGRDAARLAELARESGVETRAAPLEAPDALAALCASARVLVHCAGPYTATYAPLAEAALRAGCHLVHLSAERAVIEQTFADDARARAAGVCLVPAAGFTTACGELAAWLAARGLASPPPYDAAELYVAYNTALPSAGSLRSYLVDADAPGVAYEDGAFRDEPPGAFRRTVALPPPFGEVDAASAPLADVLTLPRALPLRAARAFVATPGDAAGGASSPGVFTRDRALLERMLAAREAAGAADEAERARTRFALLLELYAGERTELRAVTIHGRDPYELTAVLAAEAALALRDPARTGAIAGAQPYVAIVDPQQVLAALARAGVRWKVASVSAAAGAPPSRP